MARFVVPISIAGALAVASCTLDFDRYQPAADASREDGAIASGSGSGSSGGGTSSGSSSSSGGGTSSGSSASSGGGTSASSSASSGGSSGGRDAGNEAASPTFTVSVHVSGLPSGTVGVSDGSSNLSALMNGTTAFPAKVAGGMQVTLTVSAPTSPDTSCAFANGMESIVLTIAADTTVPLTCMSCGMTCPDGTACNNNNECGSTQCMMGKCVPPGCATAGAGCQDGDHCGADSDCGSKNCVNGMCASPACKPCPSNSPCGAGSDCASNRCNNGLCR